MVVVNKKIKWQNCRWRGGSIEGYVYIYFNFIILIFHLKCSALEQKDFWCK